MTANDPVTELDARFSDPDAVPTPWEEVRRTIDEAELFWLSTVRSDGRPHVTPLPAVWQDGALHFCTGAEEQKGVNLARDPRCALDDGQQRLEGRSGRRRRGQRLGASWTTTAWCGWPRHGPTKYAGDWQFEVANHAFQGDGGEALVFAVEPVKVLAFAKGAFAQTRYRF